jgi:hypothetical protein
MVGPPSTESGCPAGLVADNLKQGPMKTSSLCSIHVSFIIAFFSLLSGADFTALATTNLALALTNWTVLGNIPEISSGQYQFTDPGATNYPQRFYQVVSP